MRAPVIITTYSRFETLHHTLTCLERNLLADETDVYVFSDAPKDEQAAPLVASLRERLHALKPRFKSFHVVERETNYSFNRNLTEGMDMLLRQYGTVVVVEEDVATSPYFLTFVNEGLERYKDEPRVMTICGFTNLNVPEKGDAYFTHHFAGWGWATWADRWLPNYRLFESKAEALAQLTPQQMRDMEYGGKFRCLYHLDRGNIVWDLCWHIAIRRADGLCLSPTQTLVRNTGLSSGTNFRNKSLFGHYEYDREPANRYFSTALPAVEADREVEEVLNPRALVDHGFRYNLLGRIVRFFYKKLIRQAK